MCVWYECVETRQVVVCYVCLYVTCTCINQLLLWAICSVGLRRDTVGPFEPFSEKDKKKGDKIKLHLQYVKPKKGKKTVLNDVGAYKMSKFPHGLAVIFNNVDFKKHNRRDGTEVDETIISTTFRYLGYKVIVHRNFTSIDMLIRLEEIKMLDHSTYDSFVCCFLSHGSEDKVYGSDSEYNTLESLANRLTADNCPTLAGKPKLFFIQTCRGSMETRAVTITIKDDHTADLVSPPSISLPIATLSPISPDESNDANDTTDGVPPQPHAPDESQGTNDATQPDVPDESQGTNEASDTTDGVPPQPNATLPSMLLDGQTDLLPVVVPSITDFNFAFATSPGYVAYRDRQKGSMWVAVLCETFCTYSTHLSLDSMLKIVHREVCAGRAEKQVPNRSSQLCMDIFF